MVPGYSWSTSECNKKSILNLEAKVDTSRMLSSSVFFLPLLINKPLAFYFLGFPVLCDSIRVVLHETGQKDMKEGRKSLNNTERSRVLITFEHPSQKIEISLLL